MLYLCFSVVLVQNFRKIFKNSHVFLAIKQKKTPLMPLRNLSLKQIWELCVKLATMLPLFCINLGQLLESWDGKLEKTEK